MYYKIINKESEVYQKLHEMRTHEMQIENENEAAIKEKTGLDFSGFMGYRGQQNWWRVTQYSGLNFTEPEKVDQVIWKPHKEHKGCFVPNKKTSKGREMDRFLRNGLKGSNFHRPLEILQLDCPVRFSFPFVDIVNDVIVIYLDEKFGNPQDENVIEITSREFEMIREGREISKPALI